MTIIEESGHTQKEPVLVMDDDDMFHPDHLNELDLLDHMPVNDWSFQFVDDLVDMLMEQMSSGAPEEDDAAQAARRLHYRQVTLVLMNSGMLYTASQYVDAVIYANSLMRRYRHALRMLDTRGEDTNTDEVINTEQRTERHGVTSEDQAGQDQGST